MAPRNNQIRTPSSQRCAIPTGSADALMHGIAWVVARLNSGVFHSVKEKPAMTGLGSAARQVDEKRISDGCASLT
jgi:hypothetical protein